MDWQTLPNHVLLSIASQLHSRGDILSFILTCLNYCSVKSSDEVWLPRIAIEYPEYFFENNPEKNQCKSIYKRLLRYYDNMPNRTHWLIHPFNSPRDKVSVGYLPFKTNNYVATGFEAYEVGKRFVNEHHDVQKFEEELPTVANTPTYFHQARAFYVTMKKGDIVVVRQIYQDPREYIIGEVISDVVWLQNDVHQMMMGEMSARMVHWHYINVPYDYLSATDKKLVPYLCGQLTMSRIGERADMEYGKKELWDVARKYGILTNASYNLEYDVSIPKIPKPAMKRKRPPPKKLETVKEEKEEENEKGNEKENDKNFDNTADKKKKAMPKKKKKNTKDTIDSSAITQYFTPTKKSKEEVMEEEMVEVKKEETEERTKRKRKVIEIQIIDSSDDDMSSEMEEIKEQIKKEEKQKEEKEKQRKKVREEEKKVKIQEEIDFQKLKVGNVVAIFPDEDVDYWFGKILSLEDDENITIRWFERMQCKTTTKTLFYEAEGTNSISLDCIMNTNVESIKHRQKETNEERGFKWPTKKVARKLPSELWEFVVNA